MTDPGRFGEFVLLRRLSTDVVGERYRAASAGGAAFDDVVLLQLFTAPGTDGAAIAGAVRTLPADLPTILKPSIARAVGEIDGLPWAAYDHRQTFDLPDVLERANSGFSTLSLEHAALIAERLAKVLFAFHRAQIAHGFVVPELLSLSGDGEILLLGCEHGPALLAEAVAHRLDQRVFRYLSPEVRAGAAPESADDLYGLGVLFFELLTGVPLGAGNVADQIQSARSIATDEPLPAAIQRILVSSLAPRGQRIPDAGRWHSMLADWMRESGFAFSNFDLAFLVHELFRDRLDPATAAHARVQQDEARETWSATDEVAAPIAPGGEHYAQDATTASLDPVPNDGAFGSELDTPAPMPPTASDLPTAHAASVSSRRPLMIGFGVAAAVLAVFAAILFSRQSAPPPPELATIVDVPTAEDPAPPAVDLAASQATLERMVAESASAVEKRLADDYGNEIGELETEIEAASAGLRGTPPALVSVPKAKLPEDGTMPSDSAVRVEVLVAEDGTVREARIPASRAVETSLAEAARTAALGARFSPATVDGAPAAQWIEIVVRFTS